MFKLRNSKKGFTIMEMLIVVAIIAVLVAIAIPVFNGALEKSKEAADVANIRAAYAEWQVAILTDNKEIPDTIKEGNNVKLPDNTTLSLNYPEKFTSNKTNGIGYDPDKVNGGTAYTWKLESDTYEDTM